MSVGFGNVESCSELGKMVLRTKFEGSGSENTS